MRDPGSEQIYRLYSKGVTFKEQIGLYDTVENNENFFIGKQWEGVEANGNPTPTFNFLKRVTLFQVATVSSDEIAMQASPMSGSPLYSQTQLAQVAEVVNGQFAALLERNKITALVREFLRNAAVDGDGCTYTYFDPDMETGQAVKGDLVTEVVENTRVFFGNPCDREVQRQPWILIALRRPVEEVQRIAERNGFDPRDIQPDEERGGGSAERFCADQTTMLVYFCQDPETGHIWAGKYTRNGQVEPFRDTGLKRYPITWMNWDYVQDCYHGHALISQLSPNQVFVNQLFAMVMRSLQTTAFPKIIYDKTRIPHWDGGVGKAIGVNGGDVNSIARIMDSASVSPQISQFIDSVIGYTQNFMGTTEVAMGDARPDNTSAIIALQRASNAPLELVKRSLYQAVEDLGQIYLDMMRAYYGCRVVQMDLFAAEAPLQMQLQPAQRSAEFDFAMLELLPMQLRLDVGASSYWSEITAIQTLDNLLLQNKISLEDYLERMPDGYISKKQELIEKIRTGERRAASDFH